MGDPADELGSLLFEKKELLRHYGKSYTVETARFQGTPPMITALAAGELDIADLRILRLRSPFRTPE